MSNPTNGSGEPNIPVNNPELKPIADAVQAAEVAAKAATKTAKAEAKAKAAADAADAEARAAKNKAERADAAVEAIKTGATNAAAAAKEAANIFDDLAALRKASNVTVKRKVERVPIRIVMKPKNMFFRAHPSDDMSLLSSLVHDESEDGSGTGHLYYIVPAMRSHPVLAPRLKFFMITAIITRANVVMLFPVPIAWPPGVKDYASWQALQDIVRRTKEGEWLSFAWLEDARNYQVTAARGEIDEPKWPEGTLADWLKEAFFGRIVTNDEHEFMIRICGL
jgi:hypothetical protein